MMEPCTERDSTPDHPKHVDVFLVNSAATRPADCYLCWRPVHRYALDACETGQDAETTFLTLMEMGAPEELARVLTSAETEWHAEPTASEYASILTREEALDAVRSLHRSRIDALRKLSAFGADLLALGDSQQQTVSALVGVLNQGRVADDEYESVSGIDVQKVVARSEIGAFDSYGEPKHSSRSILWR